MLRCPPEEAKIIHNAGLATPKKEKLEHNMRHYWPIRSELAMIDGISMNGKRVVTPNLLWKEILQQLCRNYIGIHKIRLLNTNIKNTAKLSATCMDYPQTQSCERIIP